MGKSSCLRKYCTPQKTFAQLVGLLIRSNVAESIIYEQLTEGLLFKRNLK
jgi:hypothetical protein